MAIDMYYNLLSPPCRSVMMLARHLGIHLNLKMVDHMLGEQMRPSFRKMNPQHTLPTIDDNGFILWESRSIMAYLVMKYAKNDSLYPRDPEKRALVEHRLYFDIGTLFDSITEYFNPLIMNPDVKPPEILLQPLEKAFAILDGLIQDSKFAAGNNLTIADFSLATAVCTAKTFGFDIGRYYNVTVWYQRCERLMERYGLEEFSQCLTSLCRPKVNSDD